MCQAKVNFVKVLLLLPGLILVSVGCRAMPNFGPQGTIGQQRNNAILHDPFPSNDLGPAIMSGRPLGFEQPWSEPRGAQSQPYAQRGARVVRPNGF